MMRRSSLLQFRLSVDTVRTWLLMLALFALCYMSVIGAHPFSLKEKTIPATGDGDAGRQLLYLATFLITAAMSLHKPFRLLALPAGLLIALGWCWLSLTWSLAPGVAIRRVALTTIIIITVFRCVDDLGVARTVAMLRALLVLTLVLNFISVGFSPTGIHRSSDLGAAHGALDPGIVGSWRGVLPQKNFAGAVCAFTILLFVFDARQIHTLIRVAIITLTALFLFKTNSKTSIALLLMVIAVGFAYSRIQGRSAALLRTVALPTVAVLGSAGITFFFVYFNQIIGPLSRPEAFTGRMMIWPTTLAYFRDNPWGGTGFGSFWNIGMDSPAYVYGRGWVSALGNGHSGYFDLLAEIGAPGLILVLFAVLVAPVVRIATGNQKERESVALTLSMLLFSLFHNFTETSLLDRDAIVEVFMMLSLAMIYKLTRPAPIAAGPRRVRRDFQVPRQAARSGR
ncbi:O-antigen ligase family protein [Novosphingobium sp.]|uniref:O-antigen ligase family protein n=1 Tax=Novosphingobium sp. TaxID=1874826 RepID=UPI003D0B384C